MLEVQLSELERKGVLVEEKLRQETRECSRIEE